MLHGGFPSECTMSLIFYITQVQFDFGAVRLLQQECQRVGIQRPLVVTDAGVRAAGVLQKALDALPDVPVSVFDQTPSNPTEAAVRAAAARCHAHHCDGLVAVGGGLAIDCAKGVAIAATHSAALAHYATIEGGSPRITDRVAPIIAVPTTSGTGSEVARGAIVIVDDGRKLGFHSWHLVPKAALCNRSPGPAALARRRHGHGRGGPLHRNFSGQRLNPPADGIGLDGLQRAWTHIERATRNGADREARLQLMSASMQGAMAFQKGLGCVHSLSHSLGGINPRLHHGTLNAVFSPLSGSMPSRSRYKRNSACSAWPRAIGLTSGSDVAEAIREMNARLGLPRGLSDLGVERCGSMPPSWAPWRTTATKPTRAAQQPTTTARCWSARSNLARLSTNSATPCPAPDFPPSLPRPTPSQTVRSARPPGVSSRHATGPAAPAGGKLVGQLHAG